MYTDRPFVVQATLSGLLACWTVAPAFAQPGVPFRHALAIEQRNEQSLNEFFTRVEPPAMSRPDRDADFQRMLAGELDWDEVKGLTPSAEFEAMRARFESLARVLEHGSGFTPEFYGILSDDDAAFDPRQSHARQWARVLLMDALRLVRTGRDEEAAARYALLYALSDRLIESRSGLMSLTGGAIGIDSSVLEQVRTIRGEVPERVRAALFASLLQRDPRDPARYRAAAIADARRQIEELGREIELSATGEALFNAMHRAAVEYREPRAEHFMPQPETDPRVWQFTAPKGGTKQYMILAMLSKEQLLARLDEATALLDQWEAEDPAALTGQRISEYLDAIYMDGTQFTRLIIAPQLTGLVLTRTMASDHGRLLIELQPPR